METVYIALGSNLGDRAGNLAAARRMLVPAMQLQRVSREHETDPVGGPPGQPKYLNAVVEARTDQSPRRVLDWLLEIEKLLGRVRTAEKDAPRTVDLDLLLHGNRIVQEPGLTIPHPRLHQRRFVLEPLAELAPELVHPVLKKTVRELLAAIC